MVLQNYVLKGAEVIPAPAAAAVTKKQVQKCLMDTATNDIQWRILSGKSRFAEHLPLLSSAAVIFRVSILLFVLSTSWNFFGRLRA